MYRAEKMKSLLLLHASEYMFHMAYQYLFFALQHVNASVEALLQYSKVLLLGV